MSEIIKTNAEYSKWIKEVSLRFRNSHPDSISVFILE